MMSMEEAEMTPWILGKKKQKNDVRKLFQF